MTEVPRSRLRNAGSAARDLLVLTLTMGGFASLIIAVWAWVPALTQGVSP